MLKTLGPILQSIIIKFGRPPELHKSKCKSLLSDFSKGRHSFDIEKLLAVYDAGLTNNFSQFELNTNLQEFLTEQMVILQQYSKMTKEESAMIIATWAFALKLGSEKPIETWLKNPIPSKSKKKSAKILPKNSPKEEISKSVNKPLNPSDVNGDKYDDKFGDEFGELLEEISNSVIKPPTIKPPGLLKLPPLKTSIDFTELNIFIKPLVELSQKTIKPLAKINIFISAISLVFFICIFSLIFILDLKNTDFQSFETKVVLFIFGFNNIFGLAAGLLMLRLQNFWLCVLCICFQLASINICCFYGLLLAIINFCFVLPNKKLFH
jgi:hypothetical protein